MVLQEWVSIDTLAQDHKILLLFPNFSFLFQDLENFNQLHSGQQGRWKTYKQRDWERWERGKRIRKKKHIQNVLFCAGLRKSGNSFLFIKSTLWHFPTCCSVCSPHTFFPAGPFPTLTSFILLLARSLCVTRFHPDFTQEPLCSHRFGISMGAWDGTRWRQWLSLHPRNLNRI